MDPTLVRAGQDRSLLPPAVRGLRRLPWCARGDPPTRAPPFPGSGRLAGLEGDRSDGLSDRVDAAGPSEGSVGDQGGEQSGQAPDARAPSVG